MANKIIDWIDTKGLPMLSYVLLFLGTVAAIAAAVNLFISL
jgi:hypothetical protein